MLLSAVALSNALAVDIVIGPGPGSFDFGQYEVSASAPEVVGATSSGTPLVGFTVTLTNVTGSSLFDISGLGEAYVGTNGALHHEQFLVPGLGVVETPLASTFTDSGFQPSTVDSHFVQDVSIPVIVGESPATDPSGAVPEVGGQTGFGGELTGSYAFASTFTSVDVAYLVIEGVDGSAVDYFFIPLNAVGSATGPEGRFVLSIPEPASALLAGAALLGFAARRR